MTNKILCGNKYEIINGKYSGKHCVVIEILDDKGEYDFARVSMMNNKGITTKNVDLVPCNYLTPIGLGQSPLVSIQTKSGGNGTFLTKEVVQSQKAFVVTVLPPMLKKCVL